MLPPTGFGPARPGGRRRGVIPGAPQPDRKARTTSGYASPVPPKRILQGLVFTILWYGRPPLCRQADIRHERLLWGWRQEAGPCGRLWGAGRWPAARVSTPGRGLQPRWRRRWRLRGDGGIAVVEAVAAVGEGAKTSETDGCCGRCQPADRYRTDHPGFHLPHRSRSPAFGAPSAGPNDDRALLVLAWSSADNPSQRSRFRFR